MIVEIEVCAPTYATPEDVHAYVSEILNETDITSEVEEVYAFGEIEVREAGEITVEEWNGDLIDEADIKKA